MPLITPDLTGLVDGSTAAAANVTNPLNTITNLVNGQLDTTNFAANGTNLATIAQGVTWSTWTPSFGGFSVNMTGIFRYEQIGKRCTVSVYTLSAGTSNGTTFTLTLPVAAANIGHIQFGAALAIDNSNPSSGFVGTVQNSTTLNVYPSAALGAWTASGNKYASFTFTYETI